MNYWALLRLHMWRSCMQLATHKAYVRSNFTVYVLVAYLIHRFSVLKYISEQDKTVWSVSLYLSAELISEGTKVWGDFWRRAKAGNVSTDIFVW